MNIKIYRLLLAVIFLIINYNLNAQFTANWSLRTNKNCVVTGPNAANVVGQNMLFGSNVNINGVHNATDGYATQLINYIPSSNNLYWPTTQNDSNALIFPITPTGGVDAQINSLHFRARRSGSSGEHTFFLSYEANNSGIWTTIGTAQTTVNTTDTINFTNLNSIFYNGISYKVKLHLAAISALTTRDNRILSIRNLNIRGAIITPASLKPIVSTGIIGTPTKYSNTITNSSYSITNGGTNYLLVVKSGVVVSTNATPIFANSLVTNDVSINGTTTANFNSTINGLTPATNYFVRAYCITQSYDTIYGTIGSFTTAPFSIPTLNTTAPSNVLSNKATTGGNNIDSGGYAVTQKGVCWSVTNNPTATGNLFTNDGVGGNNFSTIIKNLLPNTKYYIKAYAKNQLGFGYGNLDSFTTGAAVPVLTANPAIIDFGQLIYNSSSPILSYKINASYLNPAGGAITILPTNGFSVSATFNGIFTPNQPITLNYSASTITNKVIYVKSPTNVYGPINGRVLHSGGGLIAQNADTTFLNATITQSQDTLSNMGSDFWCAFGYQEKMSEDAGSVREAKLSIYVTTGNQAATVNVELTSGGYTKTQLIPANSFFEFKDFPTGDPATNNNAANLPDSRLYSTGISKKSIHIYTNDGVPVSAFLHSYTNGNSAAGAMLFPSNTWNSSYTVQAFGGTSNNSNPNSFFFAIANEDNTVIKFTPTQPIVVSTSIFNSTTTTAATTAYPAGVEQTITLNKGEVFNAMGGFTNNNTALDLSGSTVKTTCDKRITVFGGNGRCFVNGNGGCTQSIGSDHLIQQMFPSVAWGTKYLTMPTKSSELNYFRIYVQNPTLFGATRVWVNNPTKTTPLNPATLVNNLYYEFQTNQPSLIESDKPINVTQFMLTPRCVNTTTDGGPEMIMLSPIQQSIKNATVYSALGKDNSVVQTSGNGSSTGNTSSFINVIIPTVDTGNFKLDGVNLVDTGKGLGSIYSNGTRIRMGKAFKLHPQDKNFSYANFWVIAGAVHTLSSTKGFNAIAYGMGGGESYGYNAGTSINNLNAIKISQNPYGSDTSSGTVKTCKFNNVTLQIALPYDTSLVNSIVWNAGNDATKYTPVGAFNGVLNPATSKPTTKGQIVRDGRTFYIYESPVTYQFFEEGAYRVKVAVSGNFVSDCGGTDTQYVNVLVGHDDISFTATPAGCGSTNVNITDASTPLAGTSINKWIWDFGDNKKDSASIVDAWVPNPRVNPHTYPSNTQYTIKLTTINSVGCFSYDSVIVDLAFNITSTFTASKDTACPNENIVFTATSSPTITKWFWDFNDGSAIDSTSSVNGIIAHQFTTGDKCYIVKHWGKTAAGCSTLVYQDTICIMHTPMANFIAPQGVCLPGTTQFINNSDTSFINGGMPYSYRWDFGEPSITSDTSNAKNPSYAYSNPLGSGGFIVSLSAINKYGCISNVYQQTLTNVYPKPKAVIQNPNLISSRCVFNAINFIDSSKILNLDLDSSYWDFGFGSFTKYGYSSTGSPGIFYSINKVYDIKLVVKSVFGCYSDTLKSSIKIHPNPIAATILPSSCIASGSLLFQDNSTVPIDDSVQTPLTYTWNFSDRPTDIYTTKDTTHTFNGIGRYQITHSVTTANGCSDTRTDSFIISGSKPIPKVKINSRVSLSNQVCGNDSLIIFDSSLIAIGSIKKVIINWDNTNVFNAGINATPTIDLVPQNGNLPIVPKRYAFKYPYSRLNNSVTIRFQVFNSDSCYADSTFNVTIVGMPKIKFDTIRGICVNGSPKEIDLAFDSTGHFDAFNWTRLQTKPKYSGSGIFQDTMFNPNLAGVGTHLIKVVYNLKLPFTNPCSDSVFAPIQVWSLPTVNFDTIVTKCENQQVQFFDNSVAGAGTGNINSWSWNFGDIGSVSNTSTLKNPYHTYNKWGNYQVSLTVTSDSGCNNTLSPLKTIAINPIPKVNFDLPKGTCVNSPVVFKDRSKIADSTMNGFTHTWYFGDKTPTVSGSPLINPPHTYSVQPTDSVKLIVTSQFGCIDSLSKLMPAGSIFEKPIAAFTSNGIKQDTIYACSGSPIVFADASDSAVDIANWTWGDNGTIIENGNPKSHTYNTTTTQTFAGKYFIDDKNGCRSDAINLYATIWALPTANFDTAKIKCEKDSIRFTDLSTNAAGTGAVNKWLWKFGEPTSNAADSSNLQHPKHLYSSSKQFTTSLVVTNSNGCVSVPISKSFNVNPKPLVNFSIPNKVCEGTPMQFTNLTKIADSSMPSLLYRWTFGDPSSLGNNNSTLTNPQHIYSGGVTDSIRLIVTSNNNCVDSLVKVVSTNNVKPAIPTYKIDGVLWDTLNPKEVCLNTPIKFEAGFAATSYTWTFGDTVGVTYSSNRVTHIYPNATSYSGSLSMVDLNGCVTKPVPINVSIWALPTAQFEFDNIRCAGKEFEFRDLSFTSGGAVITNQQWNFGDPGSVGNILTGTPVKHIFSQAKSYTVGLAITNINGCKVNTSRVVNINPTPKVNFKLPDTVCLPLSATFTDLSTISDNNEAQFKHTWNFDDPGSIGNVLIGKPMPTATHVFSNVRNYKVKLTVESKDGCIADSSKTLLSTALHNKPVVRFSVKTFSTGKDSINYFEPKICVGDSLLFKDLSANVKLSSWDFANGIFDNTTNPKPQYANNTAGFYPAKHWIMDNWGCESDRVEIDVTLSSVPTVKGNTVYTRPLLPIRLTPKYTFANDYKWQLVLPTFTGKTFLNFSDVDFPICTPTQEVKYLVTAYNDACSSKSDSFIVKMLEVPNIPSAFSPNGDNINDEWDLGMLKYYAGASVQVFDRFGKIVFDKPIFSRNWNGRIQNTGDHCPTGVYYYVINPGSGVPTMSGYVTILR